MKKYIKKIVLSSFLALPLFLTPSVTASTFNSELDNNLKEEIPNNESSLFRAYSKPSIADAGGGGYRYGKTIVLYYSSLNQIPYKYSYSEYSSTYQTWMKGNLSRTSVTQINLNRYKVVFQGTLVG